eukprot:gene13116-3653_t
MASLYPMLESLYCSILLMLLSMAHGLKMYSNCDHSTSQYCSIGKVGHFYGSVQESEGMMKSLQTVSYEKELILVTTYGSRYLEFFFQLHRQLHKLGFAHFMALTMQEEGCTHVKRVGMGIIDISCGWDESPMHKNSWSGGPLLWHLRWKFLGRASRVGYNVLSMDSDFAVFNDPYPILKGPVLKHCNLNVVAEGAVMNGGFCYIQNAKADGPSTWMLHHTTEVPLRWMDDDLRLIRSLGKMKENNGMCCTFGAMVDLPRGPLALGTSGLLPVAMWGSAQCLLPSGHVGLLAMTVARLPSGLCQWPMWLCQWPLLAQWPCGSCPNGYCAQWPMWLLCPVGLLPIHVALAQWPNVRPLAPGAIGSAQCSCPVAMWSAQWPSLACALPSGSCRSCQELILGLKDGGNR